MKQTIVALMAGTAVLASAATAGANVLDNIIYNNGVTADEVVGGYSSTTGTAPDRQVADDFILGGGDWLVTDVHWLGIDGQNNPVSTFNVYFYNDAGGQPTGGPGDPSATAIATRSVSVTGVDTGETVNDLSIFAYEALIDPVELMGDTLYWLAVQSSDPFNWFFAVDDEGGNAVAGMPDVDFPYWTDLGEIASFCEPGCSTAFSLTGRQVPVPEPVSLMLMTSGLALGFVRRGT